MYHFSCVSCSCAPAIILLRDVTSTFRVFKFDRCLKVGVGVSCAVPMYLARKGT